MSTVVCSPAPSCTSSFLHRRTQVYRAIPTGKALGSDLLEGKLAHIGLLGGVLNRHADETPVGVQFDEDVVVQVTRLGDVLVTQRDEQRIRIGKVADFAPDPLKERSKKALCTVSPSGKRTTRR